MADVEKLARDSVMLNGTTPYLKTGASRYDEGLRKQYFADVTRFYADRHGDIASNTYEAKCQGIGSGDWYDWTDVLIRVSPAATASTGETMPDDWQKLHVLKPLGIDTVPIGAYLTFGGNTWIVYKGRNMGSVLGDGIIRRCNSVINVLDWYGNIVPVPMSYAKMGTLGNASHATENSIVAKNYISCICQLNEHSAVFAENTRIILGKTAYSMRGLNDFTREFTDDQDSVHLLTFTIERSAPLPQDRLDLQCADYDSFRWELLINAPASIAVGASQQIEVESKRMGETVVSTEEHPISYVYKSSNPRLSVDENGVMHAAAFPTSSGTATIIVSLAQNPEISQAFTVAINKSVGYYAAFTTNVPQTLPEYESVVVKAALFNASMEMTNSLQIQCSGPPESTYGVEKLAINEWRISAYGASNTPLTMEVTGLHGGIVYSASKQIILTTGK